MRLINTERESELGQAENDAANDGDLIAINALTGPAPPTCLQALAEYHSLNYSDPIKCADTPLMTRAAVSLSRLFCFSIDSATFGSFCVLFITLRFNSTS